MTTPAPTIKLETSRRLVDIMLIICLGFVALGLWIMSEERIYIGEGMSLQVEGFNYWAALACVIIFGACFILGIQRRIKDQGSVTLRWNGFDYLDHSVAWIEVQEIEMKEFQGIDHLLIKVSTPEQYLRRTFSIQHVIDRMNYKENGTPLVIPLMAIKEEDETILQLFQSYWQASRDR